MLWEALIFLSELDALMPVLDQTPFLTADFPMLLKDAPT
jgi:hypothetical protein